MPPRFAYWTILIDNVPTAFRARQRDELVPTARQLQRTRPNIVMKWFAHGKLWDSPEAERASRRKPKPPREERGREWRPGGRHRDPRARFQTKRTGAVQRFSPAKRTFKPFPRHKRRRDEPE